MFDMNDFLIEDASSFYDPDDDFFLEADGDDDAGGDGGGDAAPATDTGGDAGGDDAPAGDPNNPDSEPEPASGNMEDAEDENQDPNNPDNADEDTGDDDFNIDTPDAEMDDGDGTDTGDDDGGGEDPNADSGGGGEDTDMTSDEEAEGNPNKPKDADIFSSLTPVEQKAKIKALKQLFVEMYANIGNLIERLNVVSIHADNANLQIKRCTYVLLDLKKMISDYVLNIYNTKSYLENDIMFNRYLAAVNSIKLIIQELEKAYEKSANTDGSK